MSSPVDVISHYYVCQADVAGAYRPCVSSVAFGDGHPNTVPTASQSKVAVNFDDS